MEDLHPEGFTSPREYLKAVFALRKSRHSSYSVRAWAKQLGYSNSSLLADIISGRRRLSASMRRKLLNNLKLPTAARRYFEVIALMADAKSAEEREIYQEQFRKLRPQDKVEFADVDQFCLLRDWYHLTILEMLELKDFVPDFDWIVRRLGQKINEGMARSAVERLQRVGLLRFNEDGAWEKSDTHLCIGGQLPSRAIQEHHQQFLERARQALGEQTFKERDFSGSTISLRAADVPRVKDLIEKFHEELHQIGCRHQSDDVYRVNIQLFKLTKELKDENPRKSTKHRAGRKLS